VGGLSGQSHRNTETGTIHLPDKYCQRLVMGGHSLLGTKEYPLSKDPDHQLAQLASVNASERFADLAGAGFRSRYFLSTFWTPTKDQLLIVAF
jgi:hypothetical protein